MKRFTVAILAGLLCLMPPTAVVADDNEVTSLRWATSSVGSAGHRAKVGLMALLNRELPDYRINVMPTPGAVASLRGYAMGRFDGYYGADIAFRELATDSGRFAGFREHVEREAVQSFWAYSMEVGLAIRAKDRERFQRWGDLDRRPVFTGPAPWDIRVPLERALEVLEVNHRYRELDTGLAGASLARGDIDAFVVYTAGGNALASWVEEAAMATDIAILNPAGEEISRLREAGMEVVELSPAGLRKAGAEKPVHFVPFYYGFHVGTDVPGEAVYRMLTIIEKNAADLADADAVFAQIASNMPEIQRRGVAAAIDSARVHPGLARYMRERDVWDSDWDDRIADEPAG